MINLERLQGRCCLDKDREAETTSDRNTPESSVLSCSSPRYNFGDEDGGVFSDVWVINPSCDAEAQARIALNRKSHF